ncbi:ABC-three component system middle component 2 [Gluconobacter sp.]|uniref:ABC-three component system middle component 2 n=1 Tax=Gluconobacter sp. TaxID=1876758 RepID=UPI0039EC8F09
MEAVDASKQLPLFNSALETGVRAIVFLNAAFPRAFDLAQLTWFDYLVVHTADVGGPKSLHPDLPQRTGELLVRRRVVEEGVLLMRRLHMINAIANDYGIAYQASEEAYALVETMHVPYALNLKARAEWLAQKLHGLSSDQLADLIANKIGRWALEFQGEVGPESPAL